ncbi:MAG: arsenate reductase (glutaredoxin) [Sulfurimonas sp.]|uniref:arsenate reductase (glutaredoxin) n=1 Tax=Sulfurimonas sp. TaxID=2022749 RepID=UPI0028CED328|nr:arsenate reductase (glutaredoxin) [Sulfurimonas sp.]MDT8339508.1 arsenate reductase (glutaredoxin) [Sulfurimonas sp.]
MQEIKIWHNPKCSKSREAMEILQEKKCDAEVIKYLEESPNEDQIKSILKMLDIAPRELMRIKEDIYKELNLKEELDDSALISAMAKHPKLIERPIIIKGERAIIGRPTERIAEFLNS